MKTNQKQKAVESEQEVKKYVGRAVYNKRNEQITKAEAYRNYRNWIDSYLTGTDYEEPEKFKDSTYVRRRKGYKTKSLIMKTQFDNLLLTYKVNNKMELIELIDLILTDFFSKCTNNDLKPLSEREFFLHATRFTNVRRAKANEE